jgi:hypothetical protein
VHGGGFCGKLSLSWCVVGRGGGLGALANWRWEVRVCSVQANDDESTKRPGSSDLVARKSLKRELINGRITNLKLKSY